MRTASGSDTARASDTGGSSAAGSGSATGTGGGSGSSTLVVWADSSANTAKAIEPLCLAWAAANGVTCVVKKFNGGGPLTDALTKGFQSGDVPDIFEAPSDQIGTMVKNGFLAPVDLSANKDKFNPVSVTAVTLNGNTYGVPWAVENIALFVNKKMESALPGHLRRRRGQRGEAHHGRHGQEGPRHRDADQYRWRLLPLVPVVHR